MARVTNGDTFQLLQLVGWPAKKNSLDDVNWLSNLKLRASYGATGNNNIGDYLFVDQLFATNYPFGTNGSILSGQAISRAILSNPDITWEQTYSFNGGIDVALFRNAISFSLDMYRSKTDKLLLPQATMGFAGVPSFINNIGSVENNGIEFEITSNNMRRKNFRWTTTANISRTRNKILQLGDEILYCRTWAKEMKYIRTRWGILWFSTMGIKQTGFGFRRRRLQNQDLTSSIANILVPGGIKDCGYGRQWQN